MASLIKKKIGKRFYYYIVESKRVDGKPRIVSQVYLGSVENILKRFQESPVSSRPKEVRKVNRGGGEFPVAKEKKGEKEKKEPEEVEIDFGIGKLGFGGVFKGIGSLIDLVSKMTEEGKTEVSRTGEIKGLGKAKGVYGFTVKMGLGGTPTVEQFGNIRETEKGPVVEEVREPLVDVFDEKDKVLVIVELPGVDESGIRTEIKGDILAIEASNKDRKYAKEILLPGAVDGDKMQSSYKNGVLEITLPKAGK